MDYAMDNYRVLDEEILTKRRETVLQVLQDNQAKLQFDCAHYSLSQELFKYCNWFLESERDRPVTKMHVSCIWGSLALAILQSDFDDQMIQMLDGLLSLEGTSSTSLNEEEVLLQRSWLWHWTVFTIFRSGEVSAKEKILHLFVDDMNISFMSLNCLHLSSYVGACLILQTSLGDLVKDTVAIGYHQGSTYSDPITRFMVAFPFKHEFDQALAELKNPGCLARAGWGGTSELCGCKNPG